MLITSGKHAEGNRGKEVFTIFLRGFMSPVQNLKVDNTFWNLPGNNFLNALVKTVVQFFFLLMTDT
jgi:hypothetical protein